MRFKYKNRFDKQRRDIMKTIAAAGISPGLLKASSLVGGMMIARATEAQGGPTKSLLLLLVGGALDSMWRPSGSGAGMRLGAMSNPYEPVKTEMNFVAGGSMTAGGHGLMFERFTANSFNDDSFDVNMGKTIGANFPLRFLNLGVETGTSDLTKEKSNSGQIKHPTIDDPRTAFNKIMNASGGGGGGSSSSGSTNSDPRQLYVDRHREAIAALRVKLDQQEKYKLDAHMNAIEELERKLPTGSSSGDPNPGPTSSCGSVSMPAGTSNGFEDTAHLQIEIAMLALKCNITASVSLAFGNDSHAFRIPTYDDVFHQSHHCCPGTADYEITGNYMCGLGARTLIRARDEGVLDSTVVTQVTDMGDARAHNNTNVPLFVAGGGSAVRRGQVSSGTGKTSANLFQTVASILKADQHPQARNWGSTIGGIST